MKILGYLTYTEFKLFIRTFANVFFALVFPSMLLLMFGGIYGNEPSDLFQGHGTVDVSVPAYIAMIIAVTGIMSLPLSVSGYRERKILKRFKATPINPFYILLSQIFINFIMTILGMVILFLIGKTVFELNFMGDFVDMSFAFIISTLSIFALGFIIASFSPNIKFATVVANIVYFPMIFLTGATLPLEIMPETMVNISKIIPLTYAVELLKGVWLGGELSEYLRQIFVLFGILVLCAIISIKNFRWE